jgi:hypothetical protein
MSFWFQVGENKFLQKGKKIKLDKTYVDIHFLTYDISISLMF